MAVLVDDVVENGEAVVGHPDLVDIGIGQRHPYRHLPPVLRHTVELAARVTGRLLDARQYSVKFRDHRPHHSKAPYTDGVSTYSEVNMLRRLFKTGNSLVVALPREALDVLHLREGSQVTLEVDLERAAVVISAAAGEAA